MASLLFFIAMQVSAYQLEEELMFVESLIALYRPRRKFEGLYWEMDVEDLMGISSYLPLFNII